MTVYLITSLIITVIIRRITAFSNAGTVDLTAQESNSYGNMITGPGEGQGDINDIGLETTLEDLSQNMTSQDRISYYSKRGAPYPHRFSHHHHHHPPYPHHHHSRHPLNRPPPSRKKKRGRRKPKPPFLQMPYKRPNKPLLLSEMLRNLGHGPYPGNIIKAPSGPYIEEDEIEGNAAPFSSVDGVDSLPPGFVKYGRPPQSFELTDDSPDVIPIAPIEEGVVYPSGLSNIKPAFPSVIRRPPPGTVWAGSSKPPDDVFYDELPESIRNVRYTPNGPTQSYPDKDILSFLQKLKEGTNSDSKSQPSELHSQNANNATELNVAISKVLFPFLSENAIKQIQLYFNSLPNEKQHNVGDRNNSTKVVYVLENQRGNPNNSTKQYSVTEPLREDEDNSTYFIMIKSPGYKTLNATKLFNLGTRKHRPYPQSTTPPDKESLALQKYIMMLAGLSKDTTDNYLPRFNSLHKHHKKDTAQKKSDDASEKEVKESKEKKEAKEDKDKKDTKDTKTAKESKGGKKT